MTCVDVRVRCPSIDRSAMFGTYLGSPASPASARRPRFFGVASPLASRRDTDLPLGPFPATCGLGRRPRPRGPHRDVLRPHRAARDRDAPPRPTQLVPEQRDDLAERALVA